MTLERCRNPNCRRRQSKGWRLYANG